MSSSTPSQRGTDKPDRIPQWITSLAIVGTWLFVAGTIQFVALERVGKTATFLLFMAVSAPFILWLMWREDFEGCASEWKYHRSLKSRDPLTPDEFVHRFYGGADIDPDIVFRLLNLHATFWQVDGARIRPDDNYFAITGHECDMEFLDKLEREFGVTMSKEDRATLDGSFDSLVLYFHGVGRGSNGH